MLAGATFPLWGGQAEVLVARGAVLEDAVELVQAFLVEVDRQCSPMRADSDVSRLNAAGGTPTGVGQVLLAALSAALRMARATDGRCDPTVGAATLPDFTDWPATERAEEPRVVAYRPIPAPSVDWRDVHVDAATATVTLPPGCKLDLGSSAKAWAADRAAELVHRQLDTPALVGLNGDLATAGPEPHTEDGTGWDVLVCEDHRQPVDETAPGASITLHDGGLATSSTTVRRRPVPGSSARVPHLIDPRTARPVAGPWRTVSVAAKDCLQANAAAVSALVEGPRAVAYLADLRLPARLVGTDGTVTLVGGWPK